MRNLESPISVNCARRVVTDGVRIEPPGSAVLRLPTDALLDFMTEAIRAVVVIALSPNGAARSARRTCREEKGTQEPPTRPPPSLAGTTIIHSYNPAEANAPNDTLHRIRTERSCPRIDSGTKSETQPQPVPARLSTAPPPTRKPLLSQLRMAGCAAGGGVRITPRTLPRVATGWFRCPLR